MTTGDINTTKTDEPAPGANLQNIGGYAVPIDPMEDLHCGSCQ